MQGMQGMQGRWCSDAQVQRDTRFGARSGGGKVESSRCMSVGCKVWGVGYEV
jgi:hypothetical protein